MSKQTFLLYLLTWTLVALSPGPAVMCSMAQSTRHGFRASLAGVGGIQAGNLLFFVAVGLGLGTLLEAATHIFDGLRVLGAIYLFYLGLRLLIGSTRRAGHAPASAPTDSWRHRGLFGQGLLIQLTNPKALLFVSALLPQFIDAQRSLPGQLALLAAATVAVDAIVLSAYAWVARRGVQSLAGSRARAWLERAFGAALLYFGGRLLVSRK